MKSRSCKWSSVRDTKIEMLPPLPNPLPPRDEKLIKELQPEIKELAEIIAEYYREWVQKGRPELFPETQSTTPEQTTETPLN